MTAKQRFLFIISVFLSIVVWGYLVSWKFGLVLVFALLIHESGHYWQMGREGIKDKSMMFVPPLGVVAIAGQPWSSWKAELKIALAGPLIGALALIPFFILANLYPAVIWPASILLISWLNLFNLLVPVAILDGGRVIKSVLCSIDDRLGTFFYLFGFMLVFICTIIGFFSLFLSALLFLFLWMEFLSFSRPRQMLRTLLPLQKCVHKTRLEIRQELANIGNLNENTEKEIDKFIDSELAKSRCVYDIESLEDKISLLQNQVYKPRMNRREMAMGILVYLASISLYITSLVYATSLLPSFNLRFVLGYFQ